MTQQKLTVRSYRDEDEAQVVEQAVVATVVGGYDGHRGWVYAVATAPEQRRRGYARALMNTLEAALGELDCTKLNLQVREDNSAVVAFYESLGYAVEPRISMGKVLAPPRRN